MMQLIHSVHRIKIGKAELFAQHWQKDCTFEQKSPIILFHESLGSVELWRDFPEKLAMVTGRSVIAYDRLGFGCSSALDHPLAIDFVAQEAKSILPILLDHFQINTFIAMGHSVGGGMASVCAALYPRQCQALITVSAQSQVEDVTLAGIRQAKENFKNEKLFNRLAKYHADKTQWVLDAWTETWLSPDFVTWNLDEYLTLIECPLLAIHGEHDEYATLAQPRRFVERGQGENVLAIIEACGHFPHQEKQHEVLEVVEGFLKRIA